MNENTLQARMIRIGIITLAAGIVANFIPALYLGFLGVLPQPGELFQIWLVAFAAFGASWVVQPISFYPMLGISGSYVSWLCGSVADIRVPAATMAQKVTNAEPGSTKGDIMATIGIAGSVLVSVSILTIFTFIGASIVPILPKFIIKSFNFIIPAVFGAVYAELAAKQMKISVVSIALALLLTYGLSKIIPTWLLSIIIIVAGILVARASYVFDKKRDSIKA